VTSDRSLPDAWLWVRFGDVVQQVKEKVDPETVDLTRYVAGEHMDTDDLRLQRWGTVDDGYLGPAFHMRFRPGQVLYGSRRTYLRKVAVADFEGICANTTFVLEPSNADLLPEFLPQIMSTERFHEHSVQQSKGSVNPYINFRDLTWFEFALPPPELQQEICEVLSVGQRQVSSLEHALDAARCLRDAIVLRKSDVVDHVPLGGILSSCDYGLSVAPQDAGEMPILRMNNLDNEELRLDDMKWIQLDQVSESDLLQTGDILFNRTNSLEHVGKVALVDRLENPATFASYLLRLRVDRESMLPEFVAAYLQSGGGQRRIRAFITQGVSQANVNATNLKKVRIPKLDLDDQHSIVDCWQGVRDLQRAIERHCREARSVLAAVREDLLAGANHVR